MTSSPLTILIGAVALVLALALIQTDSRSESIKAWLVGAAAGLDFAQIGNIHLLTLVTIFWLVTSRGPMPHRIAASTTWVAIAAVLLAMTTFIGPLVVSHTLALQLIGLTATAIAIGLKATPEARRYMAFGLLSMCVFSASWAILQKFGLLPMGNYHGVEAAGRTSGIYREPDWLGLFSAVGIVLTLSLDIARGLKSLFLLLLGFGLLFALARASIIALGVTAILAVAANLVIKSDTMHRRRNRQALVVAAGIAVAAVILSPGLPSRIVHRFQSGFGGTSQDVGARARTRQLHSLSVLASEAPWYGDGLSAAGRVDVNGLISYGTGPAPKAVSTDWILGWWIDGKYLALPLILALGFLALRFANLLGGQLLLVVLVTSLASNATLLPITWFAVGLCLGYSYDRTRDRRRPETAPRRTTRIKLPAHVRPV